MISNDVLLGNEARDKILKGARVVYESVKSTYSPQSGNVAIEKNWGKPVVSHDGITVARSVKLKDPVENIGAQYLIEASDQTNKVAGDGTSATVILGYHILERANKLMAAGYNPMAIRRGIIKASEDIISLIEDKATPVKDGDLEKIAIISAGDEATGMLIADTIKEVGLEGGINVEEHQGTSIEQELVEGFYWANGFEHPLMMNEPDFRRAAYKDCFILVTDRKLKNASDVKPILKVLAKTQQKRCLIVGNVSGEALETLIINKRTGDIDTVSVPPVAFGNMRPEFLEDVAAQTGATLLPASFEMSTITFDHLGYAKEVISYETSTTIMDGAGDREAINTRIKDMQQQLKTLTNPDMREKLESRIAKLSGKIGIIRVGSPTEIDRREKLLRVEDAVFATKAARAEGIVPGGATTLLRASQYEHITSQSAKLSQDEAAGYRMVFEALQDPFKQLMHNAGIEDVGYHLHAALKAEDGFGYNVKQMTDDPVDLLKSGVIDPAKVVKQVVENSCSMAGIAITTNAAITINRQDVKDYSNER